MKIEIRSLNEVKPYESNARKIPQSAIDKVAASLREFGWRQPIVVDAESVIVVGHVRRLAALQLGWTEVPVHVADNLTAAQLRAYGLMDNRSHDETDWDPRLLIPELSALEDMSFDLSLSGFNRQDLDKLLRPAGDETLDYAPPLPEVPVSRRGDCGFLGRTGRFAEMQFQVATC